MTAVLAAIAAVSAIVTGVVYLVKKVSFAVTKTPAQKASDIEAAEQEKEQKMKDTGLPQP